MSVKPYVKGIALFALLSTSQLLAACTETEEAEPDQPDLESITTSFEHPETQQEFRIINAYELYQNYADEMERNPDQSQLEVYEQQVIDPIYSDCFEGGEYVHLADLAIDVRPDNLVKNLALSEKIDRRATEISIKEALFKASNFLPAENETTVCVLPASGASVGGINIGIGKIVLLYHEHFNDQAIRPLIAHEYHHNVWTEKYINNHAYFTVLDNLIFEGKAVMFEKVLYPNIDFTPVDVTYNQVHWSTIEDDLGKANTNRSLEILRGGNDLPNSYGYSEGYKMVKSYLDLHPGLKPVEWTALGSKEIFDGGKYLENYK